MIRLGKASGSIGRGAFYCGLGIFVIGFYMIILILINNSYREFKVDASIFDDLRIVIMFILLACVVLWIFTLGVFEIKRGLTDKKVRANGKRSVCRIEDFEVRSNRYGHTIWMDVRFKTASGKEDRYSARVGEDAINRFQQGMKIECYVLGEECYVDPKNIKAVESEEL